MGITASIGPNGPKLDSEQVKDAVDKERKWLEENNAVSAVTGGPVEDQEGIPLPADLHQGTPETLKEKKKKLERKSA